jgi:TonB-linked SusC/RagA family outer membrane protein
MRKLTFLLACLILVSVGLVNAQSKSISGKVFSADDGQPVIGATILVKGTNSTFITDIEGNFKVTLQKNDKVLQISYVGMKTIEVEAKNGMAIQLEPDLKQMNEVIVTASYGVAIKGTLTGASSVIKGEKLDIPVTSFDKALQGNATGVLSMANSGQPGSGQSVIIRGIGSINASTTPLYIVDGVPVSTGNYGNMTQTAATASSDNINAMANINPEDIESVTVLKDASATSIYGSRASNGVIVITTKRGKAGKTLFELNTSTGYSTRTSKNFTTLNKDQYVDYMTDALVNAGYSNATVDVNGKQVNALIANNFLVRNDQKDFYNYDWFSQAYNDNAPTYKADLSARGGNDKTQFFMSLGYLDQSGIVVKTGLKRYSGRLNIDHQASSKLKFSTNINLSYNDQQSPMTTSGYYINPIFGALMYAPIDPGTISPGSFLYNPTTSAYTPYAPDNGVNINNLTTYSNANFIANKMYDEFSSRTARLLGDVSMQWTIIDGLIFKGVAGIDYFYLTEQAWNDPRPKGNSASYNRGTAETSVGENKIINETATLNYLKQFSGHSFNFLVGQETKSSDYRNVDGIKQDFPGIIHVISAGATSYALYGTRYGSTLASFFSSLNYNYDNKYFGSASLRSDASSSLSPDQRWGTFWSLGGSWKIANESFLKDVKWVNNLTLRASYGTSGNSAGIGSYAYMGLYGGGANYNGLSGIYPSQISNQNLAWEKNANGNIGLDFSILNSRLGGTVEVYDRRTSDLLLNAPLSYTSGFSSILSNIGEISNRGIEFSLNAVPVLTKAVTWNVDLNISSNSNKIEKLNNGSDIISSPFIYRVGKDIQTFYTRPWAGVNPADGRAMYYDANGEIIYNIIQAGENRKESGSAAPKFYGGLTNKVTFFNFDLSFMFYFTYGNKIYDSSWLTATGDGAGGFRNQHVSIATDRWRKEGDIAQYPKAVYGYAAATYGGYGMDKIIFDGSYIRLRDITLGYSVPKSVINYLKMNSIRVYFQGTNLLTFTRFPDADPEVGTTGYYYLGYPNAKTMTVGLNLKF